MYLSSDMLHGGAKVIFMIAWGLVATALCLVSLVHVVKDVRSKAPGTPDPAIPAVRVPMRRRVSEVFAIGLPALFGVVGVVVLVQEVPEALRPGFAFDPFSRSWTVQPIAVAVSVVAAAVTVWRARRIVRRGLWAALVVAVAVVLAGYSTGYLVPTIAGVFGIVGVMMRDASLVTLVTRRRGSTAE